MHGLAFSIQDKSLRPSQNPAPDRPAQSGVEGRYPIQSGNAG